MGYINHCIVVIICMNHISEDQTAWWPLEINLDLKCYYLVNEVCTKKLLIFYYGSQKLWLCRRSQINMLNPYFELLLLTASLKIVTTRYRCNNLLVFSPKHNHITISSLSLQKFVQHYMFSISAIIQWLHHWLYDLTVLVWIYVSLPSAMLCLRDKYYKFMS